MQMNMNMVSFDMVLVGTRRKYTSNPNLNVRYSFDDRTGARRRERTHDLDAYTNKTIRFRLLRLLRCGGIRGGGRKRVDCLYREF
jgi:hypothetical protein